MLSTTFAMSFTVPVESVTEKGRTYINIHFVTGGNNTKGASITHENSELTFSLNGTDHRNISYDPSRDRIWQIREEEGTIFFETGPSEQDLSRAPMVILILLMPESALESPTQLTSLSRVLPPLAA